ncbi:MAG TPA: hypothetical protein VK817_13645 [Trebonia sp.]|nr:hypothetical protein [Trebonia sp.]
MRGVVKRVPGRRALAPTAVLVVAWPLLLASGPGRWCPTRPSPSPSPAATRILARAKAPTPPAPKTVAVLPPPASPSDSPPPPSVAPRPPVRRQAARTAPVSFVARGNLVPPTPSSQHKSLPLVLLVVVVLAPCVAAAVTRYVKTR